MTEHVRDHLDDVLRNDVVTPTHQCQCACRGDDAQRSTGAGTVGDPVGDIAETELSRIAGGRDDPDHVVDQGVVHEIIGRQVLQAQQRLGRQDLLGLRGRDTHPVDDLAFLFDRRVIDVDLEQEAVALSFRQRIHALVLDRVLCRHHQEWLGQVIVLAADGDLPLGHDLQQCRLHLGGRTVDLVGQ
ncbi:Uncharacterised protein [Mycobacteroides abscessus subsp. abscessus]|nr:Uncharacterised protein [Mycobacteroides abscessus subsp. abscessus]